MPNNTGESLGMRSAIASCNMDASAIFFGGGGIISLSCLLKICLEPSVQGSRFGV